MIANIPAVSKGVLSKVSHFDSKAHVEEYIRSLGIGASFFRAGYYMSNLLSAIRPTGEPKTYSLALPNPTTAPIPLFDTAADSGKFIKAILLAGSKTFGKTYNGSVAYKTPEEIVAEWSEVTGAKATAVVADPEQWKAGDRKSVV